MITAENGVTKLGTEKRNMSTEFEAVRPLRWHTKELGLKSGSGSVKSWLGVVVGFAAINQFCDFRA